LLVNPGIYTVLYVVVMRRSRTASCRAGLTVNIHVYIPILTKQNNHNNVGNLVGLYMYKLQSNSLQSNAVILRFRGLKSKNRN